MVVLPWLVVSAHRMRLPEFSVRKLKVPVSWLDISVVVGILITVLTGILLMWILVRLSLVW